MNPFSSKEYTLHGVYTFGQTTFLPLDQMAAYLKCSLTIKDDVMRVVNSGYSLVDAEYAMSKIQGKSDLLRYDVGNIVDDIFAGSEMLFKLSGILVILSASEILIAMGFSMITLIFFSIQ